MAQATRAVALQEAVKAAGAGKSVTDILAAAEKFYTFIEADAKAPATSNTPDKEPAAKKATPPAPPKKDAPAKAAPPKAAPAKTEEEVVAEATETEAEETTEAAAPAATSKDCATVISTLIKAGAREKAVALLAEFGADTLSKVKPSDYAAFVEQGNNLLLEA